MSMRALFLVGAALASLPVLLLSPAVWLTFLASLALALVLRSTLLPYSTLSSSVSVTPSRPPSTSVPSLSIPCPALDV